MATRFIETVDPTSDLTIAQILAALAGQVGPHQIPCVADVDTGLVHYYDKVNSAARTFANLDQAQTFTNKTLTAPALTAPVITGIGTGSTGVVRASGGVLTELTGDGTYAITVPIPAGAYIIDIQITAKAVWTAGTSATMIVGDSVDPDGWVTGLDVKAAPAVGTTYSLFAESAMGAADGAYLSGDNVVGPVATNFGLYCEAGTNLIFSVTKAGSGTGGRTAVAVFYVIPTTIAQVVS